VNRAAASRTPGQLLIRASAASQQLIRRGLAHVGTGASTGGLEQESESNQQIGSAISSAISSALLIRSAQRAARCCSAHTGTA
jgi:hypothetical protein